MVIERMAATVGTWRGPEADVFERAEQNGFGLRHYSDQDCYWLTCGHLSQPCLTLDDVEQALLLGSQWRTLCARAGVLPARTVIVSVASSMVGPQTVIAAPVIAAPATPHGRKPLRWKSCPHCDFATKQGKRLADHIAAEHKPGTDVQQPEPAPIDRRALVTAAASRAGVAIKPVAPPPAPLKPKATPAVRIRYCPSCYLRVSVAAKDKCDNCGAPLKGN